MRSNALFSLWNEVTSYPRKLPALRAEVTSVAAEDATLLSCFPFAPSVHLAVRRNCRGGWSPYASYVFPPLPLDNLNTGEKTLLPPLFYPLYD